LFDRGPLLHYIWLSKRSLDRIIPFAFAAFPTDYDAASAVIVIGLEQKFLSMGAKELGQFITLSLKIDAAFQHPAGPRQMPPDHLVFLRGEEPRPAWILNNGKARLLMRNFCPKRVRHADLEVGICSEQRMVIRVTVKEFVDKDTFIEDIDINALRRKSAPVVI